MENGINNGVPNSEATQFTPDRQPTPEQKKAGWERKRARQEIMESDLNRIGDKYKKKYKELIEKYGEFSQI